MANRYNVGDKVVPHGKNFAVDWSDCTAWKQAKCDGQGYLYVTRVWEDGDVTLSNSPNGEKRGVYKNSDVTPYTQKEEVVKSPKFVQLRVKNIIDLVNAGIINENDIFLVRKA